MPGRDGVQISWEAGDTTSGLGACRLEVEKDDGSQEELSTNCEGTYIYTDGEPGQLLTFRVTATDNVGNSASAEATSGLPRVTKYFYHGGKRVAMRSGGQVFYLHGDHLGSTSLTTDAEGKVVARQLYHPYGTVRYSEGTLPTDFTYTGQRAIAGTGLVFMHARYYHAGLGRFTQADTIVPEPGNPQDLNRFAYTRNNPVLYIDPSGHRAGPPLVDGICAPGTCNSALAPKRYDEAARQARAAEIEDKIALGINCFTLLVTGILGPGVAAYNTPAADSVEASKGGYGGAYYPPGQVGMAATVNELDGINDGLDYGKAPGWETTGQAGGIDLQRLANARQSLGLPSVGSEGQKKYTVAILEADGMEIWGMSAHGQDVSFPVNSISRTHAEIDALHQLYQHRAAAGVTGGRATMYVDRAPCLACGQNQGIRSGVRAVGLESLQVIYPGGSMIVKP
jgi:RHS repeat-associated protein